MNDEPGFKVPTVDIPAHKRHAEEGRRQTLQRVLAAKKEIEEAEQWMRGVMHRPDLGERLRAARDLVEGVQEEIRETT